MVKLVETPESCKGCPVNDALLELLRDEDIEISVFCESCGARPLLLKLLAYRKGEHKPLPVKQPKRRHKTRR